MFFFEKILPDQLSKYDAKIKVNMQIIEGANFSKIVKAFGNFSESEAEIRLRMGHLCFAAALDGEIVHLRWVSFNKVYVGALEREIQLMPRSACFYDAYTLPKYRNLGISTKIHIQVRNYLYNVKKIKKIYVNISQNNFPSLRAAQKEELRKIGVVVYIRIFKWKFYRFKGETEEDYNNLIKMFFTESDD